MLLATLLMAAGTAVQGELIERTLAIVGGQVITLGDVQTAISLGLVSETDRDRVTARLVERTLMLREVQRYAPPEPSEAQVDERLAAVRATKDFARVLQAGGFTEARVNTWVRDDLRIASYLNQRFAATGAATNRAELIAEWVNDLRRRTTVVLLKN